MKYLFLCIAFLAVLLSPNISSASQSDDFTNFLSNKIFNDCKYNDIQIRDGSPLSLQIVSSTINDILINTSTVINWPYKKEDISELIKIVVEFEPFNSYTQIGINRFNSDTGKLLSFSISTSGPSIVVSKDGYHILSCGNKFLDINGVNYIWDEKAVEVSKYLFKLTLPLSFFDISLLSIGGLALLSPGFIFRVKIKLISKFIWTRVKIIFRKEK